MRALVLAVIQHDWFLIRGDLDTERDNRGAHRGKAMWRHSKEEAICKPRSEAIGGKKKQNEKPANTLILDF